MGWIHDELDIPGPGNSLTDGNLEIGSIYKMLPTRGYKKLMAGAYYGGGS